MTSSVPQFLIIGAMRSGTTSLSVYLGAHPQIFIPDEKEVRYFDRHFDRGPAWYQDQFQEAPPGALVGEASPGYMYHPLATERMADALPDARLIAIVREPVDRAHSHYWLNRSLGIEPLDLAAAIEREPSRLAGGERPDAYSYLDRGRYLRQLQRVCDRYERDQLLVVLFEDLLRDPQATYAQVCRFLGVDPGFVPDVLGNRINGYVQFRSLPVRGAARTMPSTARRVVERVNTRRGVTYPPMDPSMQDRLMARFRDDNRELEAWLGRDLSLWSQTSSARR